MALLLLGCPPGRADADPLPPGALARLGTSRLAHHGRVQAVAFSPDGKLLASGGDEPFVRLWGTGTGREVLSLPVPGKVSALDFLDDHTLVTASLVHALRGEVHTVRYWDLRSGKQRGGLPPGIPYTPYTLSVSRKAGLVAAAENARVSIGNGKTGELVRTFKTPSGAVHGMAFTPDGKTLVTTGTDRLIRVWDPATGKQVRQIKVNTPLAVNFCFTPDGRTLAVNDGDSDWVRLVDLESGRVTKVWQGDTSGYISALAYSSDGKTLAFADSIRRVLHLWDRARLEEVRQVKLPSTIDGVAFSPDGKTLATAGVDHRVRLWDLGTGRERLPFPGHTHAVYAVALSPDGKTVATLGRDYAVRLWERATGRVLRVIRWSYHLYNSAGLAFSPDGRSLAVGGYHTLALYEAASGKETRRINFPKGEVMSLEFSADGRRLFAGTDDHVVRCWDLATGTEVGRADKMGHALRAFPNEERVRVFDANDGVIDYDRALARELFQDKSRVGLASSTPALSPDGRLLAGVEYPGTILVTELATGTVRCRFQGHRGRVHALAFSQDGRTLLSSGQDTTVLIWDVTGRMEKGNLRPEKLTADRQTSLWADLADKDGARAHRAIWALVASGDAAVPFLRERLGPVQAGPAVIARLIRDLDDDDFFKRQRATEELRRFGAGAEPALRKALEGKPSAEVRFRARQLLAPFPPRVQAAHHRRTDRALEALGYIGSPEARALLDAIHKE